MISIGVEGYAVSGRRTGIGRYTAELLMAAATAGATRVRFTVALFTNNPEGPAETADLEAAGVLVRRPSRAAFDVFRYGSRLGLPVPIELLLGRQDVVLYPNFRRYPTPTAPSLTIVHDLAHRVVPEAVPAAYRRQLEGYVETAVRRSERVGAVSHTVAHELVAAYPEAEGRVVVLPPGPATALPAQPPPDCRERLRRMGLEPGFVLSVGTLEPRKNLLALVQAAAALPAPVVLVGARSWSDAGVLAAVEASAGRARYLPYVADADLRALFAGAAVYAFPSRYEGFGLPLLEAMALGVPVACSDIPVFHEVAGDAAEFFDFDDAAAIASTLEALLQDAEARARLRALGSLRVRAYSWERTGRRLNAVLGALARGDPPEDGS